MKTLIVLLLLPLCLCFCKAPQTSKSSNSPVVSSSRMHNKNGMNDADTVEVTGSEFIPVLGKSETGVRPELAGTWILQSMNGVAVKEPNLTIAEKTANVSTENSKPYSGQIADDRMKNAREVRRDSTVTKTKNGVTQTETTVYLVDKDGSGNKITPPQGSNYHVPEKPSISFYGSNETFAGFTGCNRMSGRYSVNGKNSINFSNATASTKMACIGDYDENAFLHALHSVSNFKASNNQLQLLDGDRVVLVFIKK